MSAPRARFFADTSAWIEYLRATGSPADGLLSESLLAGEPIGIAGFVVTEILSGCRSETHARDVLRLLRGCVPMEPIFPGTYDHAAALYRRCRSAGRTVRGTVDCLVAAVALEHGAPVLGVDRDLVTLAEVCKMPMLSGGTARRG